jgi:hypothetical protein
MTDAESHAIYGLCLGRHAQWPDNEPLGTGVPSVVCPDCGREFPLDAQPAPGDIIIIPPHLLDPAS